MSAKRVVGENEEPFGGGPDSGSEDLAIKDGGPGLAWSKLDKARLARLRPPRPGARRSAASPLAVKPPRGRIDLPSDLAFQGIVGLARSLANPERM